jgi:multidrug resistance efflux pump
MAYRREYDSLEPYELAEGAPSASGSRKVAPTPADAPRPSARNLRAAGRVVATLVFALIAIVISVLTWQYYVTSPWTRNGAVRVQVANVAPQVSGQIVEVNVVDNQFVQKGDVLYIIDPQDFEVAEKIAKAQVDQTASDLQVKQAESERRQHLSNLATTPEERQIYAGNALQAEAAHEKANQQMVQAELNLKRTTVVSPVTGYVTNLLLRVGDYAVQGESNIAIIDSESFWIDGYFEETKMARVCVGDPAEAQLIGYAQPIVGRVETITRGISVANAEHGVQGLPSVNPIYTWVRLAQRVPVRIAIDHVPAGIPLISGMTATVTLGAPEAADAGSGFDRTVGQAVSLLTAFMEGPPAPRSGCLEASPRVATPEAPATVAAAAAP